MMRKGSNVRGEETQAATVLKATTAGEAAVTAGRRQWQRR